MAAMETQERRDARAANLAVIRRQPMAMGRNAGPRRAARGAAAPMFRGYGSMTHDQGVHRTNSSEAPPSIDGISNYGLPIGENKHHGVIGQSYTNVYGGEGAMDSGLYRGYDDETLLSAAGFRNVAHGDVRVVQLRGDSDASGQFGSDFYARHESGMLADTRLSVQTGRFNAPLGQQSALHPGATPRVREYQLNSSDRRSFGAFESKSMPDTRGSSMEVDRGRLMQQSRSRANAGGIMASRGALFE